MKAANLMVGITTLAGGALSAGTASAQEASSPFPRMAPPIVRETALPLAVIEAMRAVFGERGIDAAVLDEAMASAPAAGTDPWTRPGLNPRDRSLVTVAALIATTRADELKGQLARAMDEGLTPTEASEVVTHLAFYTGWPNAMTAVPVLRREFDRRGGSGPGEAAAN